jgi:hypothetical protein
MYEPSRRPTAFPAIRTLLFGPGRLAGIVTIVAAAILVQSSDRPISGDPSLIVHGPIQPHRNDDGSLARGKRNEVDTSNWSGYAVAKFETGQTYLGATATWTVPTATFQPDAGGSTAEYSSTWVGIGGFCENALCTKVDNSLIQLGTEQDVSSDGTTRYYAWYEMLPQFPFQIPITVSPGDSITASLNCAANCSSKKQIWTLSMVNHHTGQQWSKNFTYGSSRLSAVWIEEAPYSGGVLPLADFGTATFESLTVNPNSVTPTLDLQTNGIQMTDPWGQTAIPSPADAVGFDVCWENGTTNACSQP